MSRSNKENYEETFVTTYPKTSLLSKHIYNLSFSLSKAMEPNTLRLCQHDRFRLHSTQL